MPDYGKYVPKHYFKAFLHVLPLLWAPEEYWFRDQRTLPWDVVKPLFVEINKLRQALTYILYLVLDETMSGFRPKTSPCGGYPNITYEPRKPCELGAMIRNAIECITGMFAYQDPVEDLVSQRLKDYMQEDADLHLPGGGDLPVHTAEVLRQTKGSGLIKGGWVCGDAWFRSIMTSIELLIRQGVYSSKSIVIYTLLPRTPDSPFINQLSLLNRIYSGFPIKFCLPCFVHDIPTGRLATGLL